MGIRIEEKDLNMIFFHLSTLTRERSIVVFGLEGRIVDKIETFGTIKQVMVPIAKVLKFIKSHKEVDEIIFIHNHPSGNRETSPRDIKNAKYRRKVIASFVRIRHYIVAGNNALSNGANILSLAIKEY